MKREDINYYANVVNNIEHETANQLVYVFVAKVVKEEEEKICKIYIYPHKLVFGGIGRDLSLKDMHSIHCANGNIILRDLAGSIELEISEQSKNIFCVDNKDLFLLILLELRNGYEFSEIINLVKKFKKDRLWFWSNIGGIVSVFGMYSLIGYLSFEINKNIFGWGSLISGVLFLNIIWVYVVADKKRWGQARVLQQDLPIILRTFRDQCAKCKLIDQPTRNYVSAQIKKYCYLSRKSATKNPT